MTEATTAAATAWQAMVSYWNKYAPPARPSDRDIAELRIRLSRLLDELDATRDRPARVLVLGSTPELRTMLAAMPNVRVTLIDCVLPMMQAMTELVTTDSLDEVWIKGDWLTAPLPERYFDAVLSDLVLGNLPPEDQRALIERVRAILRPSGRWIPRVDCVDAHSAFEELDTLLGHYAQVSEVSQEDVCSLRSVAGLRYWDPATGFQSYAELGRAMEKYREGDRFVHPEPNANRLLEGLWELAAPFDRPYWLRFKEDLDAELNRQFRIAHTIRDEAELAYPGRGYYIYDLVPR